MTDELRGAVERAKREMLDVQVMKWAGAHIAAPDLGLLLTAAELTLTPEWQAMVELVNEFAERPCETAGIEDLEAGCCAPCRARTLNKSLASKLAEKGE